MNSRLRCQCSECPSTFRRSSTSGATRSSCISANKSARLSASDQIEARGAKSGAASKSRPTSCARCKRSRKSEAGCAIPPKSGRCAMASKGRMRGKNAASFLRYWARKFRSIRAEFTQISTRAIASGGCPASRASSPAINAEVNSTPMGVAKRFRPLM